MYRKIKSYCNLLMEKMSEFKNRANDIASRYSEEYALFNSTLESMQGTYTEEHIEKLRTENQTKEKYIAELEETKKEIMPDVQRLSNAIEMGVSKLLTQTPTREFLDKVSLISVSGMKLSEQELEILQREAHGYLEKRAVLQLSNKSELGKDQRKALEQKLNIPDADTIVKLVNKIKMQAIDFINNYTGEKMELSDEPYGTGKTWLARTKCHFFEDGDAEKLITLLPESPAKEELTAQEKELIDLIIDPEFPISAKAKARDIAKINPELKELLLLDSRYKEYVIEE